MDTGIDNDRQILASWQAAYGRFWGEGPTFGDLPEGGTDITFPAIPDPYGLSKIMIGSITVFADKPAIAAVLAAAGLSPTQRPETVDLEGFKRLTDLLIPGDVHAENVVVVPRVAENPGEGDTGVSRGQ